MDSGETIGRTKLLGQLQSAWARFDAPPSWAALVATLAGLAESLCLLRWSGAAAGPVIEQAGAQAVLAYGTALAGAAVEVLTPGRPDAAAEAEQALSTARSFTVEDTVDGEAGVRRVARLYLPLTETPPAVACGVVRID